MLAQDGQVKEGGASDDVLVGDALAVNAGGPLSFFAIDSLLETRYSLPALQGVKREVL